MININDVKVIYRENDEGLEIENIIFQNLLKKGVWILFGKNKLDKTYECLNVAKSVNVGAEILYDVACLKHLKYEVNCMPDLKEYINQFAEYKNFRYKSKMTQEFLYPYIAKNYMALVFIYVWGVNDETVEKALAWKLHAAFWRDKTPFRNSRENFYKDNMEEKLQCFEINMNIIDLIINKTLELLDCN